MGRQVYFSKEKINTLTKMENLIMKYSTEIFGINKDKVVEVGWVNGDITKITYEDYMQFNNIIEQLIVAHKQNVSKQIEYKNKKRKIDKMYGRSKKEILAHKRAIEKRNRKEM